MTVRHPAKFSDALLGTIDEWVGHLEPVLDPMAGIGKLAEVVPDAFLNELEPEWAGECERYPKVTVTCGDARHLPYDDGFFAAIATSPTYGNRMADHHNARDGSRRNTYTHVLGRKLTAGNTGAMQFGREYQDVHQAIYTECRRVLQPGGTFVLNVSDHIRAGRQQYVSAWHTSTLHSLGFTLLDSRRISTPRNGYGQNRGARVEFESLFLFKRGKA